jgi:hypothetical protein
VWAIGDETGNGNNYPRKFLKDKSNDGMTGRI